MEPDDEICLCFHVTKRKVENYIRQARPKRASQIGERLGAGTGCGWCRPFLTALYDHAIGRAAHPADEPKSVGQEPSAAEYSAQRARYRERLDPSPPSDAGAAGEAPKSE